MFVHVKLINRASLKRRTQHSDTKWSNHLYDFPGFKYLNKKDTKNPSMSLSGTTDMSSAEFPRRAILCITLCFSSIPISVGWLPAVSILALAPLSAVSILPFTAPPAFADQLDAMKARDFLQKGNNHLNRYEFQQALDAYTECLLCDPNNRTARENIVLTHNNWGIWWFQKRKYKEAREEWEQTLKLNPADRNARQNLQVLKVTLSRAGVTEEGEKKPPPQKETPSDFPPSQVIILTPGLKQSSQGSSGAAIITGGSGASAASSGSAAESGASASGSAGTSSGATLMGGASSGSGESADTGSGAAVMIKSSKTSPATTSGGEPSASGISTYTNGNGASAYSTGTSTESSPGKFTTAPAVAPAPPASNASTATAGGSQGENIEDMIGQIEQKIYGRKQDSLPIMKRLEKLETDTHGKTKSGTIKERIDTLRKSYGF